MKTGNKLHNLPKKVRELIKTGTNQKTNGKIKEDKYLIHTEELPYCGKKINLFAIIKLKDIKTDTRSYTVGNTTTNETTTTYIYSIDCEWH